MGRDESINKEIKSHGQQGNEMAALWSEFGGFEFNMVAAVPVRKIAIRDLLLFLFQKMLQIV